MTIQSGSPSSTAGPDGPTGSAAPGILEASLAPLDPPPTSLKQIDCDRR
jgi:hypothetical protein